MIDNSKMMIGEHFTYRGIEWMWTLTPGNCIGGSIIVRYVNPAGDVNNDGACNSFGVAPVVLFSAKHLKLSRQTRLVEIKKPKKET